MKASRIFNLLGTLFLGYVIMWVAIQLICLLG